MKYVISIDQSTQSTKAFLFDEQCKIVASEALLHKQHYPQAGWVEHDAEEIYANTVSVITKLVEPYNDGCNEFSIAITNQRETVVVWNRATGKPIANAVVWQCMRGAEICKQLKEQGYGELVRERSGLLIDPYFSGSGAKWLLDNVEGAREAAESGELCFGTIDTWLIFKLTEGVSHTTDYTNASRTMLFNIHTMDWDDDLLNMLTIPRSMMPKALPCDSVFGETTLGGMFAVPVKIAGVLGDSHGALAGQMCFGEGFGKATYGTGSSVMVNIGEKAVAAPGGLVTSVAFSALGRNFYAFEGNIHCTGVTITWLKDQLGMINSPAEIEAIATSVEDNGGVYLVPAFTGLGAPYWDMYARGCSVGLTRGTKREHIIRAAQESIAYQSLELVKAMEKDSGAQLQLLNVDGGASRDEFLMQFQADIMDKVVKRPLVKETTALGAAYLAGLATGFWQDKQQLIASKQYDGTFQPCMEQARREELFRGWQKAVGRSMHWAE